MANLTRRWLPTQRELAEHGWNAFEQFGGMGGGFVPGGMGIERTFRRGDEGPVLMGGPVVDREGHVIAVATAKLTGDGVEALGLGIPVQTACAVLVACIKTPA